MSRAQANKLRKMCRGMMCTACAKNACKRRIPKGRVVRWMDEVCCPWCGHTTPIWASGEKELPVGPVWCQLCKRPYKIICKMQRLRHYRSKNQRLNGVPIMAYHRPSYFAVKIKKRKK